MKTALKNIGDVPSPKNFPGKMRIGFVFILVSLFYTAPALAQGYYSKTPVTHRINDNCGGYYEFLPPGYANSTAKYPVIIDIHGMGGQGNGSTEDLSNVIKFNTPYFIIRDDFPTSFQVGEETFSFIVIAPQFQNMATGSDVEEVLQFVEESYRIDTNRIYLTGYSRGGEPTWRYPTLSIENARRIAALIPVAGVNTDPSHNGAINIANAKLPVWAFHSIDDEGTSTNVANTINFVNAINSFESEVPAIFTPLTGPHNLTWNLVYDPANNYNINGQNLSIYEWMLTQTRATAALPVTLQYFKAERSAVNSIRLSWASNYEENNREFIIERSSDQAVFYPLTRIISTGKSSGDEYTWDDRQPLYGNNYYRLSQVDHDGTQTYFNVVKVVNEYISARFRAYPNPVQGSVLNLAIPGKLNQTYKIRIFDAGGKLMHTRSERFSGNNISIGTSYLAAGTNFIEVQGGDFKETVIVKNP